MFVGDPLRGRDRPPVVAVGHLVPPAVQDRQIESAVERRFHPRGPAGLHGTDRIVQPHIATGVDETRHRDVVVGEEHDAIAQFRILGEPDDLLDQGLASLVGRVGLARDDQLHRPIGIGEDGAHAFGIAEHQRQPLVGRRSPCESDGQHVRVEQVGGPCQLGVGEAAVEAAGECSPPHLVDEFRAQLLVCSPDRLVGQARVHLGRGVLVPVGEVPPRRGHPGRSVHAVRDRADGHIGGVETRPQVGEHLPTHRTVQLRHPVAALPEPKSHVRHVEHAGVRLVAEFGHRRRGQPGQQAGFAVGVGVEVTGDEVGGETVDPGRHRGVGGEHVRGADHRFRGVEVEPAGHQLADAFHAEEARVSLVHVEHRRLGPAGDPDVLAERADTADAEQDLLCDPVFLIPAVEPVGHRAQGGAFGLIVVAIDVGVEEQQRDSTHRRHPHLGRQGRPAGHRDLDDHRLRAVARGEEREGQVGGIVHGIPLDLPAVVIEALAKIPGAVQQSDADQRQPEVGGRLEMVTGENAEAAGVDRQDLRDAELHREVRDSRGHHPVVRRTVLYG